MIKKIKLCIPIIFTFLVIVFFHYSKVFFAKFYPVAVNFCIFLIFFTSCFAKETVIQRGARLVEPEIKPKALEYTRNLTYVWSLVTFLNLLFSLATVYMSEKIWAVYNGLISYLFVGTVFVIEYIVRKNFKGKYDC